MIRVAQPALIGREADYVLQAMEQNRLSMGPWVERFEHALGHAHAARHVVATSSGTTALHCALLALGVRPGDRVVVPASSYIATANAVRYCGAEPCFADVLPATWTLDPEDAVRAARQHRAVGIITVNLYGVPCYIPRMNNAWVIEDACESHGVPLRDGVAIQVLSFYANKIVTCGEGGALLTQHHHLDGYARLMRGQGTTGQARYHHEHLGYNYRLTDIQAAIGLAQVEKLDEHLKRRRALQEHYDMRLAGDALRLRQARVSGSVPWVYPVLVDNREIVAQDLEGAGVETRPGFPPLHKQPPYSAQHGHLSFPVAETLARQVLLLPLHLGMTPEDVDRICDVLLESLEAAA